MIVIAVPLTGGTMPASTPSGLVMVTALVINRGDLPACIYNIVGMLKRLAG